jgi:xylan 1,4-beta-xylosidase
LENHNAEYMLRFIVFISMFSVLFPYAISGQDYTAKSNGNPLLPGYFADPTVKKFGDTYYIYATSDGIKLASGQPTVWLSKDFVNWYNYAMDIELPAGLTNCWAPDVQEGNDGKYYYFMGNCQAGCNIYGYVSDNPDTGPWTPINDGKPVIPVGTGKNGLPALDAQYLLDDDGWLYSFFGTWCTSFGGVGWAKIDTADMHTIAEEGYIPIQQLPWAFEAMFPIKINDKYILMYSSGDCALSSYAVRYAYSENITGPYNEGENNPILSTNDDYTVDGPGHHSVLKQGEDYYIVYHRHDNPHSTGGLFRQVCADTLIFKNDSTIEIVTPTHGGIGYLAENQVPYENLAIQATAGASSYYHLVAPKTTYSVRDIDYEYLPACAIDDNNGTMWKAGDNMGPQSLVIDLGSEKNIKL